jgi:divalent metal cation (Fe/Co/Zn/Cd) transporter
VAWLWVGSQVDYGTGSTFLGITVAFFGLLFPLIVGLVISRRIDLLWILARRAAGYDQREGALSRIFMVTAIVAAIAFGFWFLILEGPAPSLAPQ